jgi:hypothetical protein
MQVRGGYLALEKEGREILTVGTRLQQSDKLLTRGEQHVDPTDLSLADAQQRQL